MKQLFSILCLFQLAFSVIAMADEQAILNTLCTGTEKQVEKIFHPKLTKLMSPKNFIRLRDYKGETKKPCLAIKPLASPTNYLMISENYLAKIVVLIDKNALVTGVLFYRDLPKEDSWKKFESELAKYKNTISVKVEQNGQKELFGYRQNENMFVASSFKLFVLKQIIAMIQEKKIEWTTIVKLNEEDRSLSAGFLHKWPVGTPMTVASLAHLMISQSDNTANDHLITLVGRNNIVIPGMEKELLLKTSEWLKLRYGPNALWKKYVGFNKMQMSEVLKVIAQEPAPNDFVVDVNFETIIGYKTSTSSLCRVMYDLRNNPESLQIDQTDVEKNNEKATLFKSGGEPGVMQYTHLLVNQNGETFCVSSTWNDPKGDEGMAGTLMHFQLRAIELATKRYAKVASEVVKK